MTNDKTWHWITNQLDKLGQRHEWKQTAANETKHAGLQLNIKSIFTLLSLSRRQELNICSGGMLHVTKHPAVRYWPLTPDASSLSEKHEKVWVKQAHCICVYACSSQKSQPPSLSLWVQLSHWLPKLDSHSSAPNPSVMHISISPQI